MEQPLIASHYPNFYASTCWYAAGSAENGRLAQWALGLALKGVCQFRFGGDEFWLRPGDLLIQRAGVDCHWRVAEESGVEGWSYCYAVFHPRPHWLPWLLLPEIVSGATVLHIGGTPLFSRVHRQLQTICRLYKSGTPLHNDWAMLAIERVLMVLQEHSHEKQSDERVLRAMEMLNEHYARDWTLDELARAAHASASHLSYLFQQEAGMAPMQYLEQARMQRAREMLALEYAPVTEIAQAVGYKYGSYFARRFRQLTGQPPLQYRREARANAA